MSARIPYTRGGNLLGTVEVLWGEPDPYGGTIALLRIRDEEGPQGYMLVAGADRPFTGRASVDRSDLVGVGNIWVELSQPAAGRLAAALVPSLLNHSNDVIEAGASNGKMRLIKEIKKP
jgi:hypothetical protein